MPMIHHPSLLAAGLVAFAIGVLLFRWAGRHDIKGLAFDAAWQAAKTRGKTAMTPEVRQKLDAFQADSSKLGKSKQVAGLAFRHFAAQLVSIVSYVAMIVGLGLGAAGLWWR